MKANFFSSAISVLLILLMISGMIPGMASAADGKNTDPVDPTNDLIIEDISCNPQNPEPGQAVTITITITNQGTGVSEPTDATCKIGKADPETIPVPKIDPETSLLVSFTWVPNKEGTVKITATVEDSKKTIKVLVAKKTSSNLTIESLSAIPENPKPDSEVTVNALVKNMGTETSEPTDLTYKIGKEDPETIPVPKIDPEASSLVSFSWVPDKEGTVKIMATVEDSKKTIKVLVAKKTSSNLTIESLSTIPENPKPDSKVTVNALIKNVGTETSEPTYIIYTIGEVEQREVVPSIEGGSETSVSHIWKTSDKEETVIIKASLENIEDSQKEISVVVAGEPLPDLIIEDIYPESSTQPEIGKPLNFILKIKNQGEATANSSIAKYSINGASGGEIPIPELSIGSSTNAGFSLIPEDEESISITVLADSGWTVSESNENNNEFSKVIDINHTFPDLRIESISLNPDEPHPGENVTFTVTVNNIGSAALESSEIKYYINGTNENYAGVIPVPALAAGETKVGTFFWTPGNEGQIEVKTIVDAGSVISESDETNNELTKTATVSKETVSSGSGGGGSSGSSSNSAGSGSTSKEPVSNVDAKELSTRHIVSGYHVKFDFVENATCIINVEFDPKKTFKRTTTIVEVLKNKSVFVPELPPGRIYKHVNIWVGDNGAGLPASLKNGLIEFKVEKAWIEDNNINQSQITLQWYDNGWQPLYTKKVREDKNYVYFKSETSGFSCFAITKYTADEENKPQARGQGKIKETSGILGDGEKTGIFEGNTDVGGIIKNPMGKAKIFMAISLPLFLIFVEFFVLKKKI
jgi:PGF-pre-PGF domain-containing protein